MKRFCRLRAQDPLIIVIQVPRCPRSGAGVQFRFVWETCASSFLTAWTPSTPRARPEGLPGADLALGQWVPATGIALRNAERRITIESAGKPAK
jgi:hypothetical protein